MKWDPRIQEILNTFAAQHPEMVADDTGPRMRLNTMFVEQVVFEFGSTYGMKSAGTGRPLSTETLARQDPGGRLLGWAWENKHNGEVDQFPESEDITGQIFSAVAPVNHLGVNKPPENRAPGGTTSADGSVEKKLDLVLANQEAIAARLTKIESQLSRQEAVLAKPANQESSLMALLKQADDANERRYLDLVAHFDHLPIR